MTVYVDDVRHSFGRMVMCHMWADTIDELHGMALQLGLKMQWFQCPPKASWEHYDISLQKKAQALKQGAVLTDKYGPVEHVCRLRIAFYEKHTDEQAKDFVRRAKEKLTSIAKNREMFKKQEKADYRPHPRLL